MHVENKIQHASLLNTRYNDTTQKAKKRDNFASLLLKMTK
jgi:hypothetical protein